MFASSIAPPQSPQRRLDLPHRNRSTLTNSSDEAEANSAPPRRFCTHRCILSFIRSHRAADARYRAAMAGLHRRRRRPPLHQRRLFPCHCFLDDDFHTGASCCCCSGSRSRYCCCSGSRSCRDSVLAVGRAAALLLLSFMLLLCSCSRLRCCCCCTTSGSYRSCCFSTRSRCYCTTCSLLLHSLLERLLI